MGPFWSIVGPQEGRWTIQMIFVQVSRYNECRYAGKKVAGSWDGGKKRTNGFDAATRLGVGSLKMSQKEVHPIFFRPIHGTIIQAEWKPVFFRAYSFRTRIDSLDSFRIFTGNRQFLNVGQFYNVKILKYMQWSIFLIKIESLLQKFEFLYLPLTPGKEYESEGELCRQITNNPNKWIVEYPIEQSGTILTFLTQACKSQ